MSNLSQTSSRSTRVDALAKMMSDQQKAQAQLFADQNRMVTKILTEGSQKGSSRRSSLYLGSDDDSLRSAFQKGSSAKRSISETRTRMFARDVTERSGYCSETVFGNICQFDGNDTLKTHSDGEIGSKTPFALKNKGFPPFKAPGSSKRRETIGSSLTNDDCDKSPNEQAATPELHHKNENFSEIDNLAKGLITFVLGPKEDKKKIESSTPRRPPEDVFQKGFQREEVLGASANTEPQFQNETQKVIPDYSQIQIPKSFDETRDDNNHNWYSKTPQYQHTGDTVKCFQKRLHPSDFEGRDDDYGNSLEQGAEGIQDVRIFPDTKQTNHCSGVDPKENLQEVDPGNLADDNSDEEEDREALEKVTKGVNQYKSVVKKLCNKANLEYKKLRDAKLENLLKTIEFTINTFNQKCQILWGYQMDPETRKIQHESAMTYHNNLKSVKMTVLQELNRRKAEKESLRGLGNFGERTKTKEQVIDLTSSASQTQPENPPVRLQEKPIQNDSESLPKDGGESSVEIDANSAANLNQNISTGSASDQKVTNPKPTPVRSLVPPANQGWKDDAVTSGKRYREELQKRAENAGRHRLGLGCLEHQKTTQDWSQKHQSSRETLRNTPNSQTYGTANLYHRQNAERGIPKIAQPGTNGPGYVPPSRGEHEESFLTRNYSEPVSIHPTRTINQKTLRFKENLNRPPPKVSGENSRNFTRREDHSNRRESGEAPPSRFTSPVESNFRYGFGDSQEPSRNHSYLPGLSGDPTNPPPNPPSNPPPNPPGSLGNPYRPPEDPPDPPGRSSQPPDDPSDPSDSSGVSNLGPNPRDPEIPRTDWRFRPYEEKTPLKLQLKKFDGKNVGDEYIIFREQFMTLCGGRQMEAKQKVCYLFAYLEGQALLTAKQAMGRCVTNDSFKKVMNALEARYGGEERMKRNYLNDLRAFAPINKVTSDELWKLHFLISDIREWMIAENRSQIYDRGSFVVQNIKEVLPPKELGLYLDEIEQGERRDCLETLHNFVLRRARAAQNLEESRRKTSLIQRTYLEEITEKAEDLDNESEELDTILVSGEQKAEEVLSSEQRKFPSNGPKTNQTTRDSLGNSLQKTDQTQKPAGCPHCNGPHALWKCDDFKMQPIQQRYIIVKNKNLCYHCLARGHGSKVCTFNKDKKCGIDGCTFYHNRLLHRPKNVTLVSIEEFVREMDGGWEQESTVDRTFVVSEPIPEETLTTDIGNYVSIRTTIVEVGKSKGPKKRIVIALDSCANNSNIDEDLARELDLPILKSGIRREVHGMLSEDSYSSNLVQFYVNQIGSEKKYPVTAYTVKNLLHKTPIVDWEKESDRYPHLKKGNPVPMEPGDKFGVLLGTDHGKLQLSDAKIVGPPGEPDGERTTLGWAFSGPVKNIQISNRKQKVVGLSLLNHLVLSVVDNGSESAESTENQSVKETETISYTEVDSQTFQEDSFFLRSDNLLADATGKNLDDSLLSYLRMKGPHYAKETVLFNDESYIDLGKRVEQLWELDHLGIKELMPRFSNSIKENPREKWSDREKMSDDKLRVIYLPEKKQFQVSIPWKNDGPSLTSNRFQVICRQRRCEQNLVDSGVPLEEVQKIIDGYLEKGYIRKLQKEEVCDLDAFYLPWFPVIDRSRDSTPVRLVFDAAAKDRTGKSLNSEIELTPNRLQDLFKIWMRLRKYQWVVTSDVSEMFLKCILDPKDRRYHRFTFNGEDYEWMVTLFGNLSSPNGSQKVLDLNCELHGKDKPEAVESVRHSCYMDDVADTREEEEKAWQLVKELILLLPLCGMPVRKFYTNSPLVLSRIDPELLAKQITFNETNDVIYENGKVLGMQYDATEEDCLVFVSKFQDMDDFISWKNRGSETKVKPNEWTKRLILRAAASIFDPLGLISPFTVRAKVLLQKIWGLKIDWDQPLPEEIVKKWLDWLNGVFEIPKIKISRWTGFTSKSQLQIHIFSDASEEGFCVTIYSRVKTGTEVKNTLLAAKSRVTPLKTESISRLELVACVLGVRMWSAIRQTYPTTPENTFFWTDSEVCLHWINVPAKSFKAFVAHRVGEIQSATEPLQWRHVPGSENPADVGTRPITVAELSSKSLWWKGPEFLAKKPSGWPKGKVPREINTNELKQEVFLSETRFADETFGRIHPRKFRVGTVYNGLRACVRRWATVFRAVENFKRTNKYGNGVFHPDEISRAETFLIQESQKEFYQKEIKEMTRCRTTLANCKDPVSDIRQFNPFIDEKGTVRSNSRLSKFKDIYGFEKTHPIILHRKSDVARLLVEEAHLEQEHTIGITAMKAKVCEKYTILGLGTLCNQVQSNCYRCKMQKGVRLVQQMAPLPITKLEEKIKAFENTGMDFAGPFEVKVARRMARKKVYILVITCLGTRAVHLETTSGMTTNDTIAAISRFCDIRGTPKTIVTDNQTSFHKADKDLHEWISSLDWKQIEEETGLGFKPQSYGITWLFNPPYSPHFGGVFETVVKATKRALNATVKKADLTEDEFRTFVYSVMSRLNDRPIAMVGQESKDLSPLTPNCFLMSHLGYTLLPPNNVDSRNISPKERWKYMLEIRNHFWKRFSEEIVPLLRTRHKWSHEKDNLEVDDVVLEFSNNSPRHAWKMLRVSQIFPSEDGLVRKVEVTNSAGQTYIRPIANLIPIVQN